MISIIIPCLNEERTLPGLLQALHDQTIPPDEIIVADAGSTDGTVEAAQTLGARVVPGGLPAAGRNAGAAAASGDLLLFFDADVMPGPNFLENFIRLFEARNLDIASCFLRPLEADADLAERLLTDATNLYMQIVQHSSPHAPGFCILTRRRIFEAVGGFDETLAMSEDHDFVQRAAALGKFGIVPDVTLGTSMRRLRKEGVARLAIKYLYCELYVLAGMPVTHTPFAYTFGDYANLEGRPRHRLDLAVRRGLKRLTDPLARLSASGRQTLRSLAFDFELSEINFELDLTALGQYLNDQAEAFDRRLHSLRPADLTTIRRYLSRRRLLVRYLSQLPGRTVRHTFSQSEALRERALAFVQMQWEQIQQVRPLEKLAELTEDDRLLLPGQDGNLLLSAQFLSKPDSPESGESK